MLKGVRRGLGRGCDVTLSQGFTPLYPPPPLGVFVYSNHPRPRPPIYGTRGRETFLSRPYIRPVKSLEGRIVSGSTSVSGRIWVVRTKDPSGGCIWWTWVLQGTDEDETPLRYDSVSVTTHKLLIHDLFSHLESYITRNRVS